MVSQAIELNDQLQKVLTRHDDLLSGKFTFSDRPRSTGNHLNREEAEEEEEEEPEQLFRRYVYVPLALHLGRKCFCPSFYCYVPLAPRDVSLCSHFQISQLISDYHASFFNFLL